LIDKALLLTYTRPFLTGITLLLWVTTLLIIGCLTILFTGQISALAPILAVPVAIAAAVWCAPSLNLSRREIIISLVASIVIIGVSLTLSVAIYDASWDGQGYQFEGTRAIADGWDIYRQNAPDGAIQPLWLGFYSKGSWVMSGALVKLFDNPEIGKAINLILMAAVLTCAPLTLAASGLKRWQIWLVAGLLALNPINIAQVLTYYVDGQLACALTLVTLTLAAVGTKPSRAVWVALTCASILLISVKLNGVIFLTASAGIYALWHWLTRRPGGRALLWCGIIAYVVGIGLVSWNPFVTQYATQTIEHRDPFYPTSWQAITFIERNTPPDLLGKGWAEKFTRSFFARYAPGGESPLKLPFTIAPEEIFWVSDARWSGFGPLFSGGVILIVAAAITALIQKKSPRIPMPFVYAGGALLTIVLFDAWWARYVPHLWVWAVLVAGFLMRVDGWARRVIHLALITLIVNVGLLLVVMSAGTVYLTLVMQRDFNTLAASPPEVRPITVNFDGFLLVKAHFDQSGVRYIENLMLPCTDAEKRPVQGTQVKYCP